MTNNFQIGFSVPNFVKPPHPKGISLDGQQTKLVPLDVANHAKPLYDAYISQADETDWLYLPYGPFARLEEFQTWLASVENLEDPVFFTIIRKSDNKALGLLSFLRIDQTNAVIEVGHIHYSRELQQSTLATEVQFLLMDWVFANGYRRYEWKCDALNLRSRKSAERLGFSYEGIFRQALIYKGRNRDTAWFAMIDKDWPRLKVAFQTYMSADNFDKTGIQRQSLSELTKPLLFKIDDGLLNGL